MIENKKNAVIVFDMIDAIHENAAYLSELDGATGDGDHGINMDKGFQLAKTRIKEDMTFSEALKIVGKTLIMDIGGSMGPIYGTMFSTLSRSIEDRANITAIDVYEGLEKAFHALQELAGAEVGDKTLIDTIYPALVNMREAIDDSEEEEMIYDMMREGAKVGMQQTKEMQAKLGRAARLGKRSIGYLDAGATSCWILLDTMALSICKYSK